MLHNNWLTYLESSVFKFFYFILDLEWLVTNIPEGIFSTMLLGLFHKVNIMKGASLYYLLKVLALGHKFVLGKPLNCVSY